MALFTVSDPARINDCLPLLGSEDALLLLDSAHTGCDLETLANSCDAPIYALAATGGALPEAVTGIDYAGWVDLTVLHAQHVHWR